MKQIMDRRKQLKEKFRNRSKVFAAWTSIGNPAIAEIFSKMSVDFVGIDIEHGVITHEQAAQIIAYSQGGGVLCLPRVASHNPEMIRRLLDAGADGIIVPTVSTVDEVEKIIQWVKYPPVGSRGFGVARAQGYGFEFEEYIQQWNETSSLVIQIENMKGVENIDDILKYDEIDAVMLGPYDISGSVGVPGQLTHPDVLAACQQVVDACKKHHKSCGTQIVDPVIEQLNDAFSRGYSFIVVGSDVFTLWKWGEKVKQLIEQTI